MRILYVTQVDMSRPHGGTRHVVAVVRGLADLGHEVVLIAPGQNDDAQAERLRGIRQVRPPRFLKAGVRMESALAALAAKEVARGRPDVAYVRLSPSSSAVAFTLTALRVPIVVELNGRVTEEMKKAGRGHLKVSVTHAALAGIVEMAAHTVVVQKTILDWARDSLGAKRVSLILNGADLDVATPGDRDEAKQRLGLPVEQRVVTMVGSLVPELRLDLLAEAHRGLTGTALLVVGDGPQADFVHAMALAARPSSPVLFVGPKPHAEAIDAIRASHVCVNVRDGDMGMRGFEYAAVGRRQVAFRVRGTEFLEGLFPPELEAVHLVDERSSAALKEGLRDAMRAERTLGELPDDAVEAARSIIGWDRTAKQISELLSVVLGGR